MNGLLLLSKYPIETPLFHEVPAGSTKGSEDDLARKGVITATIRLPGGLPVRLGITHANTVLGAGTGVTDPAYWTDIGDLAYWTVMGGQIGPAIMMGDLNVHDADSTDQEAAANYKPMTSIFAGVGALDADRQVNKRNSRTIDWAANPLLKHFFPDDAKKPQACLDYVFYRPEGPGLTIKPETAKAITDWKYPAQMDGKMIDVDLSDHYPLRVTFSLWTQQ